ncbi:pseudouridine kinase [Affinibrenneria salicis]|uniref:Pseudouridine kinase n=1 Tax=Affinibrenneria salicis TaxID=2590031 RepID=A0A5J5G1I1_9GAMM|nr:PfkB family carbohydrate kinase [Affinibrenneria salicis]KAA9000535.1 pseudouridine kinase [Affinibrenneria salicis]
MLEQHYIVTIGSINMDIIGYPEACLNYADSNPGKIRFTPGGVARNIAQNLALLGKQSFLFSVTGNDFYGRTILEHTQAAGVNVEKCVVIDDAHTSSYLSLLDENGEMLVAINDMQIVDRLSPTLLQQQLPFIRNAALIIADCNLSQETLAWLFRHAGDTPIFVDPVSAHKSVKIQDWLHAIHTLKPNRLEAETLSGLAIVSRQDAERAAAWFHRQAVKRVILSMGAEGVYYSERNGAAGWSPPVQTTVINVTGAGDAMMAGLASCWLDRLPLAASVRFAQACSALTLSSEFTNSPELSFSNVNALLESDHV